MTVLLRLKPVYLSYSIVAIFQAPLASKTDSYFPLKPLGIRSHQDVFCEKATLTFVPKFAGKLLHSSFCVNLQQYRMTFYL